MPLIRAAVAAAEELQELVGSRSKRLHAGGCQILFGDAATAIIVPPGDSATSSCVWNNTEFRLRNEGLALPAEPFDPTRQGLPVHLLFETDRGPIYLGTLHRYRSRSITPSPSAERQLLEVDMRISPPLERDVLELVRPSAAPRELPGLGWLETLRHDRAAALEEFISGWYGPPDPAAGPPPALPPRVPARLSMLYRLAHGRPLRYDRPIVLGTQNRIFEPDQLYTEPSDGSLVFGCESQGGFEWSLDQYSHGDDPTVWTTENVESVAEPEPLSGFLIQFSLYEAQMSAPHYAILDRRPRDEAQRLTGQLIRLPLAPARWHGSDMEFHVGPGLIASGGHIGDGSYYYWLGASHRAALAKLSDLDIRWRRFDG